MLQTPQLVIFDEATSAPDNTSEAIIQQNIEMIFSQKNDHYDCSSADNSQEGDFKALSETKGLFQDFLQQKQTA
jgi:hypothetical protein